MRFFSVRKMIIFSILFFSYHVNAEDKRIYGFTSEFVECVKGHSDESNEDEFPGNSVSGVMNGESLVSAPLGNNYWGYMNCLSRANSGQVNLNLTTKENCPELSVGGLYLPPGLDGKRIGVKGRFFVCSSGSWSVDTPSVRVNGEIDNLPIYEEPAGCESQTITVESCSFTFENPNEVLSLNGETRNSSFGPLYGDVSGFEGKANAVCENGDWVIKGSSCLPLNCQSGTSVRWVGEDNSGVDGLDNVLANCSGDVLDNGSVTQSSSTTTYFSTEVLARKFTKSVAGNASFVCSKNQWVKNPNITSQCSMKSREELSCFSIESNGNIKHYCE